MVFLDAWAGLDIRDSLGKERGGLGMGWYSYVFAVVLWRVRGMALWMGSLLGRWLVVLNGL